MGTGVCVVVYKTPTVQVSNLLENIASQMHQPNVFWFHVKAMNRQMYLLICPICEW